ncbi:MAG: ribonuclease H family protein [Cyclobacteriaceae bacterium]
MGKKFYVVWKGRNTGVFTNWDDCNSQVKGFKKAEYKSFPSMEMAEEAYNTCYAKYKGINIPKYKLSPEELEKIGSPNLNSMSVDGAWNTSNGIVEYQGVDTKTKKILFHMGPFEDGTINMVEFLALVHGLAYCKQNNINLPIYTDSLIAISWVRDKEVRTSHEQSDRNTKLFELLDRALNWLKSNEYQNKVLKWETKAWGENPADFGRKK